MNFSLKILKNLLFEAFINLKKCLLKKILTNNCHKMLKNLGKNIKIYYKYIINEFHKELLIMFFAQFKYFFILND